jgi:hypothetical protein
VIVWWIAWKEATHERANWSAAPDHPGREYGINPDYDGP